MTFAPGTWVRESVGVYIGNASAVRDYRVQLRGNRSLILWSVYLLVLIGFGMLTYSEAAGGDQMSVVEAQRKLQTFYSSIMGLLATMVALIAPALTATSVVAERQRRSLDLVFSAPVSAKYYLVGKMISSYRYIWMLLVLSLPVTAACVVLGGASWPEVLASYALLSLHGLIYTSIALLFSTLAMKPVGAIIWSYIGVIAYASITGSVAAGAVAPTFLMSTRPIQEMPFIAALSPYIGSHVSTSYTVILDYHVPNWSLAILFTLAFTKLMLLGAGSVLSGYGSGETKGLRIYGLIYLFLASFGWAVVMGGVMGLTRSVGRSVAGGTAYLPPDYELYFARSFLALIIPLGVVLPFISCYGVDLEKKFWPDGIFNVRRMWIATPSGGLPYALALGLAVALGQAAYSFIQPDAIGPRFVAYVYYGLALIFASWSLGRLTSAMNNGLRYARTLQFTALVLAMGLPVPFLMIADSVSYNNAGPSVWDLYVLRPLFSSGDRSIQAMTYGTILIVVGIVILRVSEAAAKAKYRMAGIEYGRA